MPWSNSSGWNGRGWNKAAAAASTSFVGSSTATTTTTSETLNFSVSGSAPQVGDLAIIFENQPTTAGFTTSLASGAMTSCGALGTWAGFGWRAFAFYRVLQSGDFSGTTVSVTTANADTGSGVLLLLYRGPTVATAKSTLVASADPDSTLVFPGFAPSGSSKGVVIPTCDHDGGTPTYTPPAPFSTRMTSAFIGLGQFAVFDALTGYTNSTTTLAGFITGQRQAGVPLELT